LEEENWNSEEETMWGKNLIEKIELAMMDMTKSHL